MDVFEKPISRLVSGLDPILIPKNSASGTVLECSNSPSKMDKSHGPIQFNNFASKESERFRSIEIPVIGLALVERIKLPPQPGPHQFFLDPNEKE